MTEDVRLLAGEIGDVAATVSRHLSVMGVPHYIGGSIASSIHGVVRATADIDFVAFLSPGQGRSIADAVAGDFYASADAAEEAIRRGASFNLIHLATSLKVDLFVPADDLLADSAVARAEQADRGLRVASAEDTLLAKLRWYRQTGETSDRQWNDVLGILRVARHTLSTDYCDRMAAAIGVGDLLKRARGES
ncbi:MAG: hypothetical protein ACO3ZY_02065 [Phycisphaerales bacterium]